MNAPVRLAVAIAVSVLLVGCQTLANQDPVDSAEQAHAEFNAALAPYLSMNPPVDDDLDTFVAEGQRLLGPLREAYDGFSDATDELIAADVAPVDVHDRYRYLLGSWLASQERQAEESARCLQTGDPEGCFAEMRADPQLVLPPTELAEMQQLSSQLYGP